MVPLGPLRTISCVVHLEDARHRLAQLQRLVVVLGAERPAGQVGRASVLERPLFMNVHTERANGRVASPVWSNVSPTNRRRPIFTG